MRLTVRLTLLALLAGLVLAATAAGGASASQAGARPGGVVPHAGTAPGAHALRPAVATAGPDDVFLQQSPCTPPSCWVMRTNTTYAIYWVPSGPQTVQSGYENEVDQYLTDVAAASGSQTNVFSVATQYFDSTGFIAYQSKFGGSDVDTDSFPANGCDDSFQGTQDPVCLTDAQLQAEIQKVITAKGWPDGPDSLFFILTPDGVGSCFDGSSPPVGQCSTNAFCAYHSGFTGTNGQPVLYANEPYDATIDGCHDVNSQGSPNNDDADATINTMSHEQNEAISDPAGNAWLNSDGDEIADICAWDYGAPLGTAPDGQPYNQLINGHEYALQQVYSNDGSVCLQRYIGLPANTTLPTLTGVAVQKKSLSGSQGSWTQLPTAYAYEWLRCGAKGTACQAIANATSATYKAVAADGGHTLEVRVSATNSRGTRTAVSKPTGAVVGVPASRKAPHITGHAEIGRRLTAGRGSWSGPPTTYRFQWLRCSAGGGSCVRISRATHAKYRLTKRDAKHRLRVRVTAANVAGTKMVTSRSTARVAATTG
jgi:hypothetical protein